MLSAIITNESKMFQDGELSVFDIQPGRYDNDVYDTHRKTVYY